MTRESEETSDFDTLARFEHLEGVVELRQVAPRMAVARNADGITVLSLFTDGGAFIAQIALSAGDSQELRDSLFDDPDLTHFTCPNGSEVVLDPACVVAVAGGPDTHSKIHLSSGAEILVCGEIEQVLEVLRA